MKKYAVIVAGGNGQRMGAAIPKQFLELNGKSLLWHSIAAFVNAFADIELIIVVPKQYMSNAELAKQDFKNVEIQFVVGGETRYSSVQNGLQMVKENSIVFVHDAVRSLVTKNLIESCYHQALVKGSAIPAVSATDSIRLVKGEEHEVADRNLVRVIQTPQTFQSNILLPAFEQPYQTSFTDEATVVEANGQSVFLIEGDYNNIKITRPVDLLIAAQILNERKP
jgi:2-C-methyl-D-erythritol 4-phosphate cytidylyltransferase